MSSDGREEKEIEKEKEKETENKRENESKEELSENCGATGGEVEEDTGQVRFLQALLERFGLARKPDKAEDQEEYPDVLDEVTFAGIAKYIQSDKCKNIVVMAGAGISTAAGIPDFRSPGSGLYDNLQQYDLPYPEAIFEIGFFHSNPEPFFKLAKELYPGNFKPTTSHYFIRLLNEKGLLLRHYTQNIDTLERIAGIPGEKLVEAHGTFYTGHCLSCRKSYTQDWIKHEVFADKVPTCEKDGCDGVVKPDIIFFGESLPGRFSTLQSKDMPKCDLLIIMGTSLAVQPFASLVDHVSNTTPRLLINREKCGQRQAGSFFLFGGGAGLNFDDPKNYRDVAWLGSCDEGCLALADLLGWKEELTELVDSEHAKIDKEATQSAQLKENDKKDPSEPEGCKNSVEKEELHVKVKETDGLEESASKELQCNKCDEGEGEEHECEQTSNEKKVELDGTKDVSTEEDSKKSV